MYCFCPWWSHAGSTVLLPGITHVWDAQHFQKRFLVETWQRPAYTGVLKAAVCFAGSAPSPQASGAVRHPLPVCTPLRRRPGHSRGPAAPWQVSPPHVRVLARTLWGREGFKQPVALACYESKECGYHVDWSLRRQIWGSNILDLAKIKRRMD